MSIKNLKCSLKEEINKNLIPEQSKLLIAPMTIQFFGVVQFEDYQLKCAT
jgi:hypothetical protein